MVLLVFSRFAFAPGAKAEPYQQGHSPGGPGMVPVPVSMPQGQPILPVACGSAVEPIFAAGLSLDWLAG